ncbi:unnamed protein product [Cyprideis torosa]|uniref:Uncharacterized protein n=1 Tax=Cyprideis torosa TaxID=163714 RepID=A0A7R8W7W0_9CRUS|nr:unnamed protein product [Cyprideis torosa]CAG0887987.1 unnamed protein product [Cyprideis torosa]
MGVERTNSAPKNVEVPADLICRLCLDALVDAVLIPCCGASFCLPCVKKELENSDDGICPECHEKDNDPNVLIPNRFLRTSVATFLAESGYKRRSERLPMPPSVPDSDSPARPSDTLDPPPPTSAPVVNGEDGRQRGPSSLPSLLDPTLLQGALSTSGGSEAGGTALGMIQVGAGGEFSQTNVVYSQHQLQDFSQRGRPVFLAGRSGYKRRSERLPMPPSVPDSDSPARPSDTLDPPPPASAPVINGEDGRQRAPSSLPSLLDPTLLQGALSTSGGSEAGGTALGMIQVGAGGEFSQTNVVYSQHQLQDFSQRGRPVFLAGRLKQVR